MKQCAVSGRRLARICGVLLCLTGLVLFGEAAYIHAKALLAQMLLERSWSQRLDDTVIAAARPWPWADTEPVARLQVPRLGVRQIVLAGASGRTLAFGPAHLDGTAIPGAPGNSIVTGHRDTHFSFLRDLVTGDVIHVQRYDGIWMDYRVTGATVLDARTARFDQTPGRRALTLVTCYPFDAVATGGPLRYAVFGEAISPPGRNAPPVRHAVNAETGRPA